MDRKFPKETKRFEARDDYGNSFTIVQWTEFVEAESRAGSQTLEGMKSYKTAEGHTGNRLDKGKYRLVVLNLDLHSDDPDAP